MNVPNTAGSFIWTDQPDAHFVALDTCHCHGSDVQPKVNVGLAQNQANTPRSSLLQQRANPPIVKVMFQNNAAKADAMTAAVNAFNTGNNRTLPSGEIS
jgi:hypothetical protein